MVLLLRNGLLGLKCQAPIFLTFEFWSCLSGRSLQNLCMILLFISFGTLLVLHVFYHHWNDHCIWRRSRSVILFSFLFFTWCLWSASRKPPYRSPADQVGPYQTVLPACPALCLPGPSADSGLSQPAPGGPWDHQPPGDPLLECDWACPVRWVNIKDSIGLE